LMSNHHRGYIVRYINVGLRTRSPTTYEVYEITEVTLNNSRARTTPWISKDLCVSDHCYCYGLMNYSSSESG